MLAVEQIDTSGPTRPHRDQLVVSPSEQPPRLCRRHRLLTRHKVTDERAVILQGAIVDLDLVVIVATVVAWSRAMSGDPRCCLGRMLMVLFEELPDA